MYLALNQVEHPRIDHARTADAFDLLGRLDEFAFGHQFAAVLEGQHLLVKFCQFLTFGDGPVFDDFLSFHRMINGEPHQRKSVVRKPICAAKVRLLAENLCSLLGFFAQIAPLDKSATIKKQGK